MSRSLRRAGTEPDGSFTAGATTFTVHAATQRLQRADESAEYPVAFVIGSGSHASGYLIRLGDHLFQSPLCYYTDRHAYGLAPGYEQLSDPDFTRPVNQECLLCHSGSPLPIPGTANRYKPPFFGTEAISCERCHGPSEQHLRNPVPGSIVNPAKLSATARDSVCEQCHLAGVARIPNPGKTIADFRPGRPLEEVFTVYTRPNGAFKVISHAEQLARSACARNSQGKLWCGTCHDPHPKTAPTSSTYNARCLSCHKGKLDPAHPADTTCVTCHMPRRPAQDGGHTVFTDHRIARRPEPDAAASPSDDLVAWREPDPGLRQRNLALAYVTAGISARSPAQIVRGYRMLTEVQKAAPEDIAVLKAIGRALLLGKEPAEALRAFDLVLRLQPDGPTAEEDAGTAALEADRLPQAAAHLEHALQLDPLLLSAATALEQVYRKQGNNARAEELVEQIRRSLRYHKL